MLNERALTSVGLPLASLNHVSCVSYSFLLYSFSELLSIKSFRQQASQSNVSSLFILTSRDIYLFWLKIHCIKHLCIGLSVVVRVCDFAVCVKE